MFFVPSAMNFEQMNALSKRNVPYAVRARLAPVAQTKENARYAPVVKCERARVRRSTDFPTYNGRPSASRKSAGTPWSSSVRPRSAMFESAPHAPEA